MIGVTKKVTKKVTQTVHAKPVAKKLVQTETQAGTLHPKRETDGS